MSKTLIREKDVRLGPALGSGYVTMERVRELGPDEELPAGAVVVADKGVSAHDWQEVKN